MKKIVACIALTVLSTSLWAATQTLKLSMRTMDCAACPITIKKALMKVPGVSKAEVSFEKKEAVVTFDDTKTNVDALKSTTKGVGYPSTLAAS
ncbi:mercury resistance system periplasmic binding protein MerP [Noviherbaspirillum agri]